MIKKSATNKDAFVNNMLFTANARAAWEHILFSMKNANLHPSVLMPSYIGHTDREGSGVFDPVTAQSANAGFYKLKDDLSIDIDHLNELIATKKFSSVLVIHYFGFCRNDMEYIKNICKKHNLILIEDCAHAFHLHEKKPLIGNYGDFSFYSLHKYLPTTSGGILKINSNVIACQPLPAGQKINFQDFEQYAISDLNGIAKKRRANYRAYEKYLRSTSDIEIMYRLQKADVPQTFPIRIKNGNREKLYFYLIDKGAPTIALYYRLIEQITTQEFPLSHSISKEILNLPVHQDTSNDDIHNICVLIKQFYDDKSIYLSSR